MPRNRAIWAWDTKSLIFNAGEKESFLYFCKSKNIKDVFLQLPLSHKNASLGRHVSVVEHEDRLREFLKNASSGGIRVHGLDGHPSFSLKENHATTISIVKAVLDFNKASAPGEKFYGVHFDIEPYLLPGFQIAERKEILKEFLDLNRKCADLVHAKGKGLVYGVDIPFWFAESIENVDEETTYVISFNGEKKPTSFHLTDICDNVGIMDYRNFGSGPDGMIEHGLSELEYAETKRKKIFIGVETSRYPEARITFVYGPDKREFNRRFRSIEKGLEDGIYFGGFKLKLLNDGANVHAGLIIPKGYDEKREALFHQRLIDLSQALGRNFYQVDDERRDHLIFEVKSVIDHNIEYKGFKEAKFSSDGRKEYFAFFETEEIMLPKISFYGMGEERFEAVLKETEDAFREYSAFSGFAIHHYKAYQKLCSGVYL